MIVGIDIGTSYSSICVLKADGHAEPVYVSTGVSIFGNEFSLPSAVFINDNTNILVGQAACTSRFKKPENFKNEFKRDFGQDKPYQIGNRQLLPHDLYREIFIHLKSCIEKLNSNEPIEKAWITHPASYNMSRKQLLAKAANRAGIMNVELIDEPTAASRSFLVENSSKIEEGQVILLYDFGGGTFDVALLKYESGDFVQVVNPMGVGRCGGSDIDQLIFTDILNKVPVAFLNKLKENPILLKRFKSKLMESSIRIKHQLTMVEECIEDIEIDFDLFTYSLDRQRFNQLISPLIDETIVCVQSILRNSNYTPKEIHKTILVGGSSRIPLVRTRLEQLGLCQINSSMNAELAIAAGAAYMGIVKDAQKPEEVSSVFYENEDDDVDEFTVISKIAEEIKQPHVVVTPHHQNKPTKQFFNPDLFN